MIKQTQLHRSTVDIMISWAGAVVAVALLAVSVGLFWAQNFVHDQVSQQLEMQQIVFPEKNSAAFEALPASDQQAIEPYAGKTMTTGAQAKVYADNYIAVHLQGMGDGKTYAELSSQSMANPDDKQLAGLVDTVFRGEMLRGALLNAYAFGTMGTIALYTAWGALAAAVALGILVTLGFVHAKRVA